MEPRPLVCPWCAGQPMQVPRRWIPLLRLIAAAEAGRAMALINVWELRHGPRVVYCLACAGLGRLIRDGILT